MAGETSVNFPNEPCRAGKGGFTLVELLIVVSIMAVMVGVTASLMGAFIRFYEMSDNQSTAKRRAQDVFNTLETPIQHTGVGIPPGHFDFYFQTGGVAAPIWGWGAPLSVKSNDLGEEMGDVLRVVYSIPAGAKNDENQIVLFSGASGTSSEDCTGTIGLTRDLSFDVPERLDVIIREKSDTRSFITFSGTKMHPLLVRRGSAGRRLDLCGKRPHKNEVSTDLFVRNTIHPYQDLRLVRASVAYVDKNSVFHLLDVNDVDPSGSLPQVMPTSLDWSGFRVEGVKAVRFEIDPDDRSLTAHVLVEGDVGDSSKSSVTATRKKIEADWSRVLPDLQDGVHYESHSMTWRTRSVQKD